MWHLGVPTTQTVSLLYPGEERCKPWLVLGHLCCPGSAAIRAWGCRGAEPLGWGGC